MQLLGVLLRFMNLITSSIWALFGTPWCCSVFTKYHEPQVKTMRGLILALLAGGVGTLINVCVLLACLHWYNVVEPGPAYGLHAWEWALLGMGVGFALASFYTQVMEFYTGQVAHVSACRLAGAFGVKMTHMEDDVVALAWMVTGLLFAFAAFFFATNVAKPIEQLSCAACVYGTEPMLLDSAGNCCDIIRVSVLSTQFLAAVGGNVVSAYGISKIIFSSYVSAVNPATSDDEAYEALVP
mmetsp:Transcript_95068/g.167911  ORF Transcript_95068/g.167911 Transcript_95068/m.167911 type:complete len:240 (+) Transcript_95068:83-802(+)